MKLGNVYIVYDDIFGVINFVFDFVLVLIVVWVLIGYISNFGFNIYYVFLFFGGVSGVVSYVLDGFK